MRRFYAMIKGEGDGLYGVWDMEQRVYRIHSGFGFTEVEAEARAEADRLEAEHDTFRFESFMLARLQHFFNKKVMGIFEKDFRRWYRENHGRSLSKDETAERFHQVEGWRLVYIPKEAGENEADTNTAL